jgi:hypothetical protein
MSTTKTLENDGKSELPAAHPPIVFHSRPWLNLIFGKLVEQRREQ